MGKRTAKRAGRGNIEERLEGAARAFEEENFEAVLAQTNTLVTRAPKHPWVLHYRAAAFAQLDKMEEAAQAYHRALKVAPEEPELLLSAADFLICRVGEDREALEEGLALCARGRKLAEREDQVEWMFEFLCLEGMGLNQLGECDRALASLEAALELMPRSVDASVERGIALFELCRFPEAQVAFERVLKDAPDEAWAYHYLGLMAERRGEVREAKRRFAKAQVLMPEEFPPPVELSEEEFDRALEAAVKALPERVKGYLENATISVEDIPPDEDLTSQSPPLSPCILGVFRGMPVDEVDETGEYDDCASVIVLYQKNLERFAKTREELIEQIGITVMHEVGHLVGLDEEELSERGLD